jgi:hypothetical protein
MDGANDPTKISIFEDEIEINNKEEEYKQIIE